MKTTYTYPKRKRLYRKGGRLRRLYQTGGPDDPTTTETWFPPTTDVVTTPIDTTTTTTTEGEKTIYTPPATTPEGDEAYALLTDEEKKTQDTKYISAHTTTEPLSKQDVQVVPREIPTRQKRYRYETPPVVVGSDTQTDLNIGGKRVRMSNEEYAQYLKTEGYTRDERGNWRRRSTSSKGTPYNPDMVDISEKAEFDYSGVDYGNVGYRQFKTNAERDEYNAYQEELGVAERQEKYARKQEGGYRSRYQLGGGLRPQMFQGGGMYADNTVAAAGQGLKGSTANIVYQEQSPELQQQRLEGLEQQQQMEAAKGERVMAKTDVMTEQIDPLAQQAYNKSQAKFATGEAIVGTATQLAGIASAGSLKSTALSGAIKAGKAAKLAGTGSAFGAGAKALLSSGAGIGAIASLAGAGLKKWAADDDPTTADWGEVGGSALSAAGTGMAIGSVIPGIGTAVGAIVGGLYGAGKAIFSAKKARKAKKEQEAKIQKKKDKYNKEFMQTYGAQMSNVRAGALKQKTYSGYDLGRNISAQLGGLRMGTPRYGYVR